MTQSPKQFSRPDFIIPKWPAPARVRAVQTTRRGGVSTGPYRSLNLCTHAGDEPEHVRINRGRLAEAAGLPGSVRWLRQVHGISVVDAHIHHEADEVEGDAVAGHAPGVVCAVLTADCLPVLLCSRDGRCVAAVHAGWRGLAGGVLEATVAALKAAPDHLLAWLGPAIGPEAFEVGAEVRAAFLEKDARADQAFRPAGPKGKYLADLYTLAVLALRRAGLVREALYGGGLCTFSDAPRFFSYRRDGQCGRMASLIWLERG